MNLCSNCPNFAKLNIVKEFGLCVACYNMEQYQKGEPYVCNYCHYTCLRVNYKIACDSCNGIFENNNIPKIDIHNQSIYNGVLTQLKGTIFNYNLSLLKKLYGVNDDCIYMSDIPKKLINYIDNNGICEYNDLVRVWATIECSEDSYMCKQYKKMVNGQFLTDSQLYSANIYKDLIKQDNDINKFEGKRIFV